MVCGVVEVVALLGSVKRGFCRSSAVRAIVDQVTAAVEDKPGPTTRRHQRPAGCDTQLEHRRRAVDRGVEVLDVRIGFLPGNVIAQLDEVL